MKSIDKTKNEAIFKDITNGAIFRLSPKGILYMKVKNLCYYKQAEDGSQLYVNCVDLSDFSLTYVPVNCSVILLDDSRLFVE